MPPRGSLALVRRDRALLLPHGLRRHRDLRRPARRGGRAQAQPARRSGSTRASSCCPVELRGEAFPDREAAAAAYARFCCGIVDAVAPYVVAVKPQLAFFEALGADGVAAFERVCGYARDAGLLVIADGKRGDIGSTARAYATAYLEPRDGAPPLADALTVNTYLGGDSRRAVPAGLPAPRRGALLPRQDVERGRARRPGADALGRAAASGSRWPSSSRSWGADLVGERGLSSVGAVVGATVPRAVGEAQEAAAALGAAAARASAPRARRPADVARAFTSGPASALVTVSRSVIYAYRDRERRLAGRRRRRGGAAARARSGRSPAGDAAATPTLARYAAPAAFLVAVTIAVLIVRSGALERRRHGAGRRRRRTTPAATARHDAAGDHGPPDDDRARHAPQFYVIEAATRSPTIADQFDTTVEQLLVLNPDVDPVSLTIGQRIRVK